MNENFTIYENGELVTPTITEHALAFTARVGEAFVAKLGNVASEALNQLDMAVIDCDTGSHLLHEYHAQKRASRLASVARQYELG